MERWGSGLNHQFAKLTYGITVPGVRIPLFPQQEQFRVGSQNCDPFIFVAGCKFIYVSSYKNKKTEDYCPLLEMGLAN